MTTIFYILIAFCLFFEVLNLAACKKVFAAVEKYKDKNDLTEISPVFAVWRMCNWIYLILCFIGLISSQWIGFLALIVLSLIPKKWFTWRIIDNILGIAILLFVLLRQNQWRILHSGECGRCQRCCSRRERTALQIRRQ